MRQDSASRHRQLKWRKESKEKDFWLACPISISALVISELQKIQSSSALSHKINKMTLGNKDLLILPTNI
jgi:hypothetical protein